MLNDDVKMYATGTTDFYQLLGVIETCSQRDLDRAWRKTALRYHPDKTGADPVAREKFHLAQIGYDILSDPTIKSLYDNARNAREQKRRQNALFEGKRKTMKEQLENRERGVKRGREEQEGDEEKFERELRRLAEDGKRRRKEREDALRRELQEQNESSEANTTADATPAKATPSAPGIVPEISRTIRVRFPRGDFTTPTKESFATLFTPFGQIESAFYLKDKKKNKRHCTGFIVYTSVVGAHAAISDAKRTDGLENCDVDWADGRSTERDKANDPETPVRNRFGSVPSTPGSVHSSPKAGGSPFAAGSSQGSSSLLDATMMRLKEAQNNRRLSVKNDA